MHYLNGQIGNEYFDGDKQDMLKTIYDNITNEIVTINDTDDCDEIADNDENTECTIDNDDEYKIELLAPGVEKKDIEIEDSDFNKLKELYNEVKWMVVSKFIVDLYEDLKK